MLAALPADVLLELSPYLQRSGVNALVRTCRRMREVLGPWRQVCVGELDGNLCVFAWVRLLATRRAFLGRRGRGMLGQFVALRELHVMGEEATSQLGWLGDSALDSLRKLEVDGGVYPRMGDKRDPTAWRALRSVLQRATALSELHLSLWVDTSGDRKQLDDALTKLPASLQDLSLHMGASLGRRLGTAPVWTVRIPCGVTSLQVGWCSGHPRFELATGTGLRSLTLFSQGGPLPDRLPADLTRLSFDSGSPREESDVARCLASLGGLSGLRHLSVAAADLEQWAGQRGRWPSLPRLTSLSVMHAHDWNVAPAACPIERWTTVRAVHVEPIIGSSEPRRWLQALRVKDFVGPVSVSVGSSEIVEVRGRKRRARADDDDKDAAKQ